MQKNQKSNSEAWTPHSPDSIESQSPIPMLAGASPSVHQRQMPSRTISSVLISMTLPDTKSSAKRYAHITVLSSDMKTCRPYCTCSHIALPVACPSGIPQAARTPRSMAGSARVAECSGGPAGTPMFSPKQRRQPSNRLLVDLLEPRQPQQPRKPRPRQPRPRKPRPRLPLDLLELMQASFQKPLHEQPLALPAKAPCQEARMGALLTSHAGVGAH